MARSILLRKLLIGVICGLAISSCSLTINPTPVGGGTGRIAFASYREGDSSIFIMNADGSELINLTDVSERIKQPVWSPDGKHIAFVGVLEDELHNHDIYVMEAWGSNKARLTVSGSVESDPSWSPDGSEIAFTSNRDSYDDLEKGWVSIFSIYTVNFDGSGLKQLTENEAMDTSPDWSPDGQRIVFQSTRDGDREIYIMDADGSNQINLTNHSANDQTPTWSPDGSMIAFTSDRDGNEEIYLMNADGLDMTRLTDDPGRSKRPVWSTDGNLIAFYSDRTGNFEVYVMATDGSGITRLTDHSDFDGFPSWQP
jgi:Tol biopolymer transport system component